MTTAGAPARPLPDQSWHRRRPQNRATHPSHPALGTEMGTSLDSLRPEPTTWNGVKEVTPGGRSRRPRRNRSREPCRGCCCCRLGPSATGPRGGVCTRHPTELGVEEARQGHPSTSFRPHVRPAAVLNRHDSFGLSEDKSGFGWDGRYLRRKWGKAGPRRQTASSSRADAPTYSP